MRVILSLAVMYNQKITQVDVNNVFLNGQLIEEVYKHKPEGFEDSQHLEYVYN